MDRYYTSTFQSEEVKSSYCKIPLFSILISRNTGIIHFFKQKTLHLTQPKFDFDLF